MSGAKMILTGDNRETLPTLPAGSVHVCITSPPYWGLRSYLTNGHADKHLEIGSEPTPEAYIETMVKVFRLVRRVLRDDGLLFVNLGDSYADDTKWGGTTGGKHVNGLHGSDGLGRTKTITGLKSGDLCNIPHRVSAALQADGWFWRDTIVWAKPAPMPSSQNGVRWARCRVKLTDSKRTTYTRHTESQVGVNNPQSERNGAAFLDQSDRFAPCPGCPKCSPTGGYILRRGRFRTTTAHEYLFMFSKSKSYFADAEACKEVAIGGSPHRGVLLSSPKERANAAAGNGHAGWQKYTPCAVETRLPRSVWSISPEPTSAKHFASFPSELPRRCIQMATSAHGCCPACGAQYAPVVETERIPTRPGLDNAIDASGLSNRDPQRHVQRTKVLGYRATCNCQAGEPIPCTVLDHFGGTGRTAQAAQWMGRRWVLCELNAEYATMAEALIRTPPRWAMPAGKKPSAAAIAMRESMPLLPGFEEDT